MALGAHSETYSGVNMDAAPTPKPAMNRPTYMMARLPLATDPVWKTTPTMVMAPVPIRAHRLPQRSVSQGVIKQAAKQPAWRVEATRNVSQGRDRGDGPQGWCAHCFVTCRLWILRRSERNRIVCASSGSVRYSEATNFACPLLLHCWHGQNTADRADTVIALAEASIGTKSSRVALPLTPSRRACHRSFERGIHVSSTAWLFSCTAIMRCLTKLTSQPG